MEEILRVDNVRKTFKLSSKQQKIDKTKAKTKTAVDGVSFSSNQGEIFGLLGPNGAGKTTTLRMIATLIKPDEGEISVSGYSVKDNPTAVRERIGFMTSELKLEDWFTPNYLFDYFCELRGMDKSTTEARKKELFTKFGIDKFAEVKVADLSTGMKQKVSLVISIAHNPEFVIFDEPTNGLDVITAKVVTDFLVELKREGKSIILSTHIFELAERLCDRIGMIVNGRMVKVGTLEEIKNGKTLEESFFDIYEEMGGEF
ncbi:MAG: ABC transporter ATP-binding protein [Lachnospiraceae bacterium]|nr:ABC transporter ATP-binding protein [Lachnospiraceae bacterium]MBQ9580717.1 ABC transporter ATP-binding protein [Lachnospiraceae bacterium]